MRSVAQRMFDGYQQTILIGREQAVAEATQRLLRDEVRLLTLTGTGGAGKTRLAVALAEKIQDHFAQVLFVDLAPLTSPSEVLPAIARSCGVLEGGPGLLYERLGRALTSRTSLLILDNCEHVLEGLRDVSALLGACPPLKIIATSRENLRLRWEWIFPVPPLELPRLDPLPPLESLERVPSVALFVQRAQAHDPSFRLAVGNARAVATLCVRLDGLPLAIELAAGHVCVLDPPALLTRLGRQLDPLVASARDAPDRHQTMRAAIRWSYDLLTPPEQRLLRRLSVFAGGWGLQAAEGICAEDEPEAPDVLPLLGRLIESSLVVAHRRPDGEMRYRLLETVREYAAEQLRAAGEDERLHRRHRDWFLEWAEQGEPHLWGHGQSARLAQIDTEFDNLRAALEWSADTPGEATAGLRLFAALSRSWDIRGRYIEGRAVVERLLTGAPERTAVWVRAKMEASVLAVRQGDLAGARSLVEECLPLARELGDTLNVSAAFMAFGLLAQLAGDPRLAEAHYEEAAALAEAGQEPRASCMARCWLGQLACLQGDYERAGAILEDARALANSLGATDLIAGILIWLGRIALGRADAAGATTVLLEGLRLCRETGFQQYTADCLDALAEASWAQAERSRAAWLLGAAEALRTRIGAVRYYAGPVYEQNLAAARESLGEDALAAARSASEALSHAEIVAYALSSNLPPGALSEPEAAPAAAHEVQPLTAREWQVAALITRGRSNRQIAEQLVVSRRTVDAHVRHILEKLTFTSRAQVAAWVTAHSPPATPRP